MTKIFETFLAQRALSSELKIIKVINGNDSGLADGVKFIIFTMFEQCFQNYLLEAAIIKAGWNKSFHSKGKRT